MKHDLNVNSDLKIQLKCTSDLRLLASQAEIMKMTFEIPHEEATGDGVIPLKMPFFHLDNGW